MRDEFLNVVGVVILGLVITIGSLAGFQMLSISPLWTGNGAAWVGAVGTVGTLAGTIWLATSETRRRVKQEMERANIVAAALAPRLGLLGSQVEAFQGRMMFYPPNDGTLTTVGAEVGEFLAIEYTPASTEELIALASMPDNCATKLAYVQAQFENVRAVVQGQLKRRRPQDNQLSRELANIWSELAYDLRVRISVVHRQCSQAAELHAAPPSDLEIYGEDIDIDEE